FSVCFAVWLLQFAPSYCESPSLSFFFFTAPSPTELYTLSLHDALPISYGFDGGKPAPWLRLKDLSLCTHLQELEQAGVACVKIEDRKSTRLNSSHVSISYAVFCLKKKKKYKRRRKASPTNTESGYTRPT